MPPSSVLFQSDDGAVVLLDLPRTIEEAQHLALDTSPLAPGRDPSWRRLISTEPPLTPFVTPEPRNGPPPAVSVASQVAQLMIKSAVTLSLDHLRTRYSGPYLLPRQLEGPTKAGHDGSHDGSSAHGPDDTREKAFYLPADSHYVLGSIQETRQEFVDRAPVFDLIVLDPPWPNRSAKRKSRGYKLCSSAKDIRELLCRIPIQSHLAQDGLVAIWMTNKPAFIDLVTGPRNGILDQWGLELVGEWAWLKTTGSGEPVLSVDSDHRKPWEPLLLAQKKGSKRLLPPAWQRRVIVSVPDAHSRKPNLRGAFSTLLPPGFRGLEVFARNLTAGWWAWGDDVLHFQEHRYWTTLQPRYGQDEQSFPPEVIV